jgi:hypothetical protein
MRLTLLALSVVAALGLTAVAAANPAPGTHFKGTTSQPPINGFNDPVTFAVGASGKTVDSFTFGTFGCMGAGGFQPGKSPWTGSLLKNIASMPLTSAGFSGSGHASHSQTSPKLTDTVNYTVKGAFAKSGASATGTIAVSEKITQPSLKTPQTCGPVTTHFSATRG